jgi:hypothetical protein
MMFTSRSTGKVGMVEQRVLARIEAREPVLLVLNGRRVEVSAAGVREVRPR